MHRFMHLMRVVPCFGELLSFSTSTSTSTLLLLPLLLSTPSIPTQSTSCLSQLIPDITCPVIAITNITLTNITSLVTPFLPHSAIDPVPVHPVSQFSCTANATVTSSSSLFVTMKSIHPSASCFPRMITTGSPYVGV